MTAVQATNLGQGVPAGAVADTSARRLIFSGTAVSFTVLASPSRPQEDFQVAGMVSWNLTPEGWSSSPSLDPSLVSPSSHFDG